MSRWQTYDEIRRYANTTGLCPICFEPSAEGFACTVHGDQWRLDSQNLTPGIQQYLEWVNDMYDQVHVHQCAECEERCPENDYLCEACRG